MKAYASVNVVIFMVPPDPLLILLQQTSRALSPPPPPPPPLGNFLTFSHRQCLVNSVLNCVMHLSLEDQKVKTKEKKTTFDKHTVSFRKSFERKAGQMQILVLYLINGARIL